MLGTFEANGGCVVSLVSAAFPEEWTSAATPQKIVRKDEPKTASACVESYEQNKAKAYSTKA